MRRSRITLILALLFIPAALAAADAPLHRTFNVAPGGTLTIDADVGNIQVSPGAGGVTVDVFQRGRSESNFEVTLDQQANDVIVRARDHRASRWFNWRNDLEVKFAVTVPSRYNLQLNTSGGDIGVGDLQGDVHCKTSGGTIRAGHITGPVEARTSGGDVSVDAATGKLDLHTSGGSIRIGDAAGSVQAKTSGGSIDVRRAGGDLYARTSGGGITIDEALGAVDAQTSGGSIRVRLTQQPRADSRLSTSGGSITVSMAPSVALDVDAHTSGGDVDTDIPVTLLGRQSDSSLEGKINGGGPKLVLRSSGGGIRLRKM